MVHTPQTGTKKSIGKVALQSISILVVVLIALFSLKFGVVEQLAVSESYYLDISSGFQTDPDVLAELARREHITGDLDKAHMLYIRALDSFVLHVPSWVGLTELLKDLGQEKQAAAALQSLENLQFDDIDLLWKKALLAQTLHQDKILLSTLNRLAEDDPTHIKKVFNLAGKTWENPLYLLRNFKISYYPDILQYYIINNRMDEALTVWYEGQKTGFWNTEATIAFVSFLLQNNEFDLALAAWRDTIQQNNSLMHNGNFKTPILNAAFGWHVSETKSVTLKNEDFGGGLTISFNGTENVTFMLSQIVPLFPGEHIFSGFFETTNLTSQQRPYWLISGYNCPGLYIEDAMLPPSEYNTEFAIPFAVPKSCKAVKIDLVRNRANSYDNLISGSLTLKNLNIERISPLPPDLAKREKLQVEKAAEPVQKPAATFVAAVNMKEIQIDSVAQQKQEPWKEIAADPVAEQNQADPLPPQIQEPEAYFAAQSKSEKTQVAMSPSPGQKTAVETAAKPEVKEMQIARINLTEQAAGITEPPTTRKIPKPTTINIHRLVIRY